MRRQEYLTVPSASSSGARHAVEAAKKLGYTIKLDRQRWSKIESSVSTDLKLSTLEAIVTVLGCVICDNG